jgi:23S rRNA G2445 N2-methylase RlmL
MQRLGTQLGEKLGLPFRNDTGDLVVTLRPGKTGWEVLYRVGNRPLGTRAWRQVNYRGSLSGTVAAALVELSSPSPHDAFLNLMCGSGTIMIERHKRAEARALVGVDNSALALVAAQTNCAAAGLRGQLLLVKGDTTCLPLADMSFDKLCADLPWGESLGTHEANVSLYGHTFAEAYRLCRPGGKLLILTQDQRALRALGGDTVRGWRLVEERTFVQRGFHPVCRVYQKHGSPQ